MQEYGGDASALGAILRAPDRWGTLMNIYEHSCCGIRTDIAGCASGRAGSGRPEHPGQDSLRSHHELAGRRCVRNAHGEYRAASDGVARAQARRGMDTRPAGVVWPRECAARALEIRTRVVA